MKSYYLATLEYYLFVLEPAEVSAWLAHQICQLQLCQWCCHCRTDYVVTNDLTQGSVDGVRKASAIHWKIEEFHRELKQTTGLENCQARKQRSQRNHINLCMQAWMVMKTKARELGTTIYEVKQAPLRDYVAARWREPYMVFV